jgi:PAS domain S-box-containing protein
VTIASTDIMWPAQGEVPALLRARAAGEPGAWPAALRTLVAVMLAARQPMWVAWGPRRALLYNDAYIDILGERHPAALGRPIDEVWADAWPVAGPIVERAFAGEGVHLRDFEVQLRRDGGLQTAHFTFSATPVRGDDGRVQGVFCACTETTDAVAAERRRQAEAQRRQQLFQEAAAAQQALQASDARVRAAMAAIGVLWTNDAEGRMTGEQPGWAQLTGQQPADYQGHGWARAVHPDDVAETLEAWQQAVAARRTFVHEHRVRRRDGVWRRFSVRAVPVFEADGRLHEWVGVHIDITELSAATEALRQADRRKDEFLATLAHELRNPLAPIRTAAHLLGRAGLDEERIAWCGDLIRRQSQTMAMLLDDLLDVSRITSGRLELRRAYVGARGLVDAAVETARPLIDAKRHALELALPPDLPLLDADPLRVVQILTNLLTNAAKYTDPGGRIRLAAAAAGDQVCFEVSDNGVGIASDQLPDIFEMFRQVKGTLERSEGGLGIGLALTRGLVELHGGRIEAFSDGPGRGARFRVMLPAAVPQAARRGADGEDAGNSADAPPRRKVLVADDNTDAADSLAVMLEIEGYEVHVAHDGLQALDLAERMRPDAALLDIGMPGVDGYGVASRLRSQAWGGELTLVATTGWGQAEDKRRAMAAGFDEHLTKPVNPESVLRILRERLEPA